MTKEIMPVPNKCQFIHGLELRDIDRLCMIVLKSNDSSTLDEIRRTIVSRTKKELGRLNLHRRLLKLISLGLVECNELKTDYEMSGKVGKRQIYYNLTREGEGELKKFLEDLSSIIYCNNRELVKKVNFI